MGACGSYFSDRAVFYLTAALCFPALAALATIRRADLAADKTAADRGAAEARAQAAGGVGISQGPQVSRAFVRLPVPSRQCGDAADRRRHGHKTRRQRGRGADRCLHRRPPNRDRALSPWAGRAAEGWGRRPILLLGYSALPIRGALLAGFTDPYLIIVIQLLDGLGAAVFGVLTPLIVSDITRGTGRYTTAWHHRPCHRRRRDLEHDGGGVDRGPFRRRGGVRQPGRRGALRQPLVANVMPETRNNPVSGAG